ncbi:MAG: outer membrane beta-barrel protein [Putridiphycobacter sp.]|nr:outer membrane beta-barrel protein [Putridiphycobacter sp.]
MRRLAIFVLLLCVSCKYTYSQTWSYGPELGLNLIQVNNNFLGKTYAPSWHTGGFIKVNLTKYLSVRSGIYFSQKKQTYANSDTTQSPLLTLIGVGDVALFDLNTYTNTTVRVTQNYFELPILAEVKYKEIALFAGIYSAIMFSAKNKEISVQQTPFLAVLNKDSLGDISNFLPPATVYTESISESKTNLNSFDFGFKLGAAYQFNRFTVNIAYSLGVIDFKKSALDLGNLKHQYFQFSLAYNIGDLADNKSFWRSRKLK